MKSLYSRLSAPAIALGWIGGWSLTFGLFLASPAVAFASDDAGRPTSTKPDDHWVVHEWGTFTSLQDEAGKTVGGINTDDEPVPKFVHRLANFLLLSPTQVPANFFQGAPSCHPDVTMRLETPVLYFHPPDSQPHAQDISVTAKFRGGWLTEFYPNAEVNAPGVSTNGMAFGELRSSTEGSLAWKNLAVGGEAAGPTTDEHVWTSPRAVQAAMVQTTTGEAERFLFYRGVGHIDAPLAISQDVKTGELVLRSQCAPEVGGSQPLNVRSLWLVDIRPDGQLAFRNLPPVTLEGTGKILAKTSSKFSGEDYSPANREKLKAALQAALVARGLFGDEARALLNTWEVSYFKSAGMRVFFMVPQAWTDFYLPLTVSVPSKITRVMVGRIELVTPQQREILRQLGRISAEDIKKEAAKLGANYSGKLGELSRANALADLNAGRQSLAQAGVSVPKSYALYLSLGRFRNALLLEEDQVRPAAGLDSFISQYRLQGYTPVSVSTLVPANAAPLAASFNPGQ